MRQIYWASMSQLHKLRLRYSQYPLLRWPRFTFPKLQCFEINLQLLNSDNGVTQLLATPSNQVPTTGCRVAQGNLRV